jgi:rare lipoprotein A
MFKPRRSQIVTTAWESALKVRSICLLATFVLPLVSVSAQAEAQSGAASIYSTESGSRTASGARLDPGALTAAHRSLPFGSRVRVTNRRNGRSVVVTINDRGPFVRGRIIDVTPAAAHALGFSGLAPVTVERE